MRVAKAKPRIRLPADERRRLIVDAAFRTIAKQGFEEFRTRDIADKVGINSATLRHHFRTKDDLIAAVAEELALRFQSKKAPAVALEASSAAAALECQFADATHYRAKHPEVLAVYREFVARAHRDRLIAALVARLNETWRRDIRGVLDQARREGILRPAIEPEVASHVLLHAIWGLVTRRLAPAQIVGAVGRQLLSLLIVPS
jgi:AcrR family transcriptional regulator